MPFVPFVVQSAFMTSHPSYRIALEPDLSVEDFIDVLQRSTLAARRPVHDADCMAGMLRHANLLATARDDPGRLVGVARAITDYHYCTYLSDLAVDVACQRQGIGKQLLEFVRGQTGPRAKLILLSAPAAVEYYPHIGLTRHDSCWILD